MKIHLLINTVLAGVLLAGCAAPKQTPVRIQDAQMTRLAQQARSLFDMQRPAQAAPLYQAALDRARALNDDPAIARLAYNLGSCFVQNGNISQAAAVLQQSIEAAKAADLPCAEAQLLLGHTWLKQGQAEQTLTLCDQTVTTLTLEHDPDMSLRFKLLKTQAYLSQQDLIHAQETVQQIDARITTQTPPAIKATSAQIQGSIAIQLKQFSKAGEFFRQETGFWTSANRPLDVAAALIRAADAFNQAQEPAQEADCRYRAARALLGQTRRTEASDQIKRLQTIPQTVWPASLKTLVPLLQQEIDSLAEAA